LVFLHPLKDIYTRYDRIYNGWDPPPLSRSRVAIAVILTNPFCALPIVQGDNTRIPQVPNKTTATTTKKPQKRERERYILYYNIIHIYICISLARYRVYYNSSQE
jgi:hypothetical protein